MVTAGMTPRDAVRQLEARLTAAGCPDADYDAAELFRLVTGRDVRLADAPLTEAQAAQLESLCLRREAREPLQYLCGRWSFLDFELIVGPGVLAVQGDLFTYWQSLPEGQLDLIVSNPPYLTAEEMQHLQPEVAQEPAMALEAGDDGLVFYRALAQHYRQALRPGGALVLEIGWQQRQDVMELLAGNGWADIECRRDYGGNDRCIIAHRPK